MGFCETLNQTMDLVPDPHANTHKQLTKLMIQDAEQQEQLVPAIIRMLADRIASNDKILGLPAGFAPSISVQGFIERVARYSGGSPCCYAVGLIWLDRIEQQLSQKPLLNSTNFVKILLTAFMLGCKYLDDFYYSNKHWSNIGGITVQEINTHELEFLKQINFNLQITREEYEIYTKSLLFAVDTHNPFDHAPASTAPSGPEERPSMLSFIDVDEVKSARRDSWSFTRSSSESDESVLSSRSTPSNSRHNSVSTFSGMQKCIEPQQPQHAANCHVHITGSQQSTNCFMHNATQKSELAQQNAHRGANRRGSMEDLSQRMQNMHTSQGVTNAGAQSRNFQAPAAAPPRQFIPQQQQRQQVTQTLGTQHSRTHNNFLPPPAAVPTQTPSEVMGKFRSELSNTHEGSRALHGSMHTHERNRVLFASDCWS